MTAHPGRIPPWSDVRTGRCRGLPSEERHSGFNSTRVWVRGSRGEGASRNRPVRAECAQGTVDAAFRREPVSVSRTLAVIFWPESTAAPSA